jgi:hypothetical protein
LRKACASPTLGRRPRHPGNQIPIRPNRPLRRLPNPGNQKTDRHPETERLPNGNYIIIWHARGNEYSLHFAPSGSIFALDGLGEGPP